VSHLAFLERIALPDHGDPHEDVMDDSFGEMMNLESSKD
jgi:hypothetical protein